MKKTILLVAILVVSYFAYGQNSNPWPTSGNVGIGTSSPICKLEINDGNGTSPIAYFGSYSTSNAKGLYFSRPSVNTNPVNIQGTLTGIGATDISLQAEGGNVGIGTTNPTEKLQVSGRILANYLGLSGNFGISSVADSRIYMQNTTPVTGANWNLISDTDGSFAMGIYGNNPFQIIKANGNIGIGTTTPAYKLDVYHPGTGSALNLTGAAIGTRNDVGIDFSAVNAVVKQYARIGLQIYDGTINHETGGLTFYTSDNGSLTEKMFIKGSGEVGIGTITPDSKLSVNGTIHSKEVKVDTSIPVPDYVFEENYQLKSLNELQDYITKNKHLPEIPSAIEMEKSGINLSEMNLKLLKKVEELTLYLIDKDKENKQQQDEINQLKQQIAYKSEKTEIDELKKQIKQLSKSIKMN